MKCIRKYAKNVSMIILVMIWRKSIHFWRKYARKTTLTFLFPVTLTFDLKFAPLVTLAQRYVFIKLEGFYGFPVSG